MKIRNLPRGTAFYVVRKIRYGIQESITLCVCTGRRAEEVRVVYDGLNGRLGDAWLGMETEVKLVDRAGAIE